MVVERFMLCVLFLSNQCAQNVLQVDQVVGLGFVLYQFANLYAVCCL